MSEQTKNNIITVVAMAGFVAALVAIDRMIPKPQAKTKTPK